MRPRLALVPLLLALVLAPGTASWAQHRDPVFEGLSYPDDPDQGGRQISAYEDPRIAAAEARVEEQDILGTLDRIDRQLHGMAGEITALQRQLDGVEARRMQAEDTLTAAQAGMAQEASLVAQRCRALYRLVRQGLARVLFGSESPVDLRRRTRYLLAILEHDRKRMGGFARSVQQREATLEQVDRDRATVAALQAELRLKEAGLRDERARKLTLLQQVRERKELATRVLAEQDRAQLGLQQASQAQLTTPAVDPSTNASFRASHGALPWPTTGSLLSGFGRITDPLTGQPTRSNGIRVAAAYGTPFRAVFSGVVKQAGFIRGYGQTVVLDHGAYTTVYAHANGLKVSSGQNVAQGEVLGFVGNSGLVDTSGYVLYFEIRYNGTPQDPLPWLGGLR
jgi:septal ring factor EnvC (AmiA/AmiB activator)